MNTQLIVGGRGTGKTHNLARIAAQQARKGNHVLFASYAGVKEAARSVPDAHEYRKYPMGVHGLRTGYDTVLIDAGDGPGVLDHLGSMMGRLRETEHVKLVVVAIDGLHPDVVEEQLGEPVVHLRPR